MADSIDTLFGVLPPSARQREAQELSRGKLLADNLTTPGYAASLFQPTRGRAVRESVGGLFGLETRTPIELEEARNKELFTKITTEAEQRFPNDRTKQLEYLASQLSAQGKVVEAQKARALAQESAKTQSEIAKQQAQAGKFTAEGVKATAQASTEAIKQAAEGLGDVKPEDFTPVSWQKYIESGQDIRTRDASLLEVKDDTDLTSYQKILKQAYPNDTAKQRELAQQYAKNYAATAGGDVNPDKVYAELVLDVNKSAIEPYRAEAVDATMEAEKIDGLLNLTDTAITGAGSSMKQFLISIGRQAGLDLKSLGSLTDTQLISRVLSKEVLKRAGNLKGALSDKDLAFLKETVGDLTQTPQALRTALMELKNTKLRAKYVNDKFNETLKTNKKALTSDILDINNWASEARTELGLINPQLVAGTFMLSNGTVNPDIISGLKNQTLKLTDVVSPDDSDAAVAALLKALQ